VRKGLLWLLGLWLSSAGQLFAQSLPAINPSEAKATQDSKNSADVSADQATGSSVATMESGAAYRGWARVEYLLWWVKNAPLPVPVVTTGDPSVGFDPNHLNTVNTAGGIGQRGTQVLFGDNSINSPAFFGMRLTLGGWVDEDDFFGVDGSGFVLERRTKRFAAASDKAGNPPLYFPISTGSAGAERGIPIADPLRSFSGNVGVNSNLQLWGAEVNGILTLLRNSGLEFTLLAGFRYADLRERLQIYNTTTDLIFGNVTNLNDSFKTTNQLYGGQIGSRLAVQRDRLSLDITGKVALGSTHQVVEIQGDITQAGPNALVPPGLGTFPGGLFAQSTNIGKRNADQFAVLPSLELKLGYEINPRTRVFAGYDLMYWSQVVRPGNQLNHNVNLSQNAVLDPNGLGKLVGPAQPAPLFNRSDFWAQGLNFGLEFRY
jgi:hypothetical protein